MEEHLDPDKDKLNETPLERLRNAGVTIMEPEKEDEGGVILDIAGRKERFYVMEDTVVFRALPHYRGNRGFFHIFSQGGECLLLKVCYSDGVRYLKKGLTLDEQALMLISRFLLQAESAVDTPYDMWLIYTPETNIYVVHAEPVEFEENHRVDPLIPRPLTVQEYDASSGYASSDWLFSRSLFTAVLPEQLSHMALSVLKAYPDIMHSFFLAFEVKVHSPSQQVINGRPYLNISGILSGMREIKVDRKIFGREFMPWQRIFDKIKPVKPELFATANIPLEEIAAFLDEMDTTVSRLSNMSFFEPVYQEPVVHLTMIGTMLYFLFQEQWLYLAKLTGLDEDTALGRVYKTRSDSLYVTGATLDLPAFFDPAFESKEIVISASGTLKDVEEVFSGMSAFRKWRRGKKIKQVLDLIHNCLGLRDKLVQVAGAYHKKARGLVMDNATHLLNKGRFTTKEQAFFFDMADFKRLVYDTFYSGLTEILQYRENYFKRSAAQVMPYEMYEGDIRYTNRISEEQLEKAETKKAFPCHAYNHADLEGTVERLDVENPVNMDGKICCARVIPLAAIAAIGKPAAIITDIAPAFSYITEYALMHNIPLYTGVRHSEILLAGKTIKTAPAEIIFI